VVNEGRKHKQQLLRRLLLLLEVQVVRRMQAAPPLAQAEVQAGTEMQARYCMD
jgi:hypothetical protein